MPEQCVANGKKCLICGEQIKRKHDKEVNECDYTCCFCYSHTDEEINQHMEKEESPSLQETQVAAKVGTALLDAVEEELDKHDDLEEEITVQTEDTSALNRLLDFVENDEGMKAVNWE